MPHEANDFPLVCHADKPGKPLGQAGSEPSSAALLCHVDVSGNVRASPMDLWLGYRLARPLEDARLPVGQLASRTLDG